MQRHNKPLVALPSLIVQGQILPSLVVKSMVVLFVCALLVTAGWAQDAAPLPAAPSTQQTSTQPATQQTTSAPAAPFNAREYAKPRAAFPNVIAPYTPRRVEAPNLTNTPRIDGLMHDGKLYISMNDAVALALENNLDIAIARYNLNIADTDVWRAKAGATILGVNSGVVQNTPGGGAGGLGGQVGSGQGGTSVGAGGAGAGIGGLVVSTLGSGSVIASFDPVLTGTFQLDQDRIQNTTPFAAPFTDAHTATWNFGYQQEFHWGTNLNVSFNNSRLTVSPVTPFQEFLTQYSPTLRGQITQHLLQGFGFAANTRFIRIAKNNRELSDVAFRLQTLTTVDQIENLYWNLVYSYENVKVQQENLAFAQKTLSDTRKQVEIGTLAPIEVVRSQSTVATDQQTLTLALTDLQLEQLLMKNALSRNLLDPRLADAEVIPTSTMEVPPEEPVLPTEDLVNSALSHRPDLAELRINLTNTEISNRAIRNALLPTLDLFAYYQGSGYSGAINPGYDCLNPPPGECPGFITPKQTYGGGLGLLVNSNAPDKGVGLQLTIPVRNRAAQATQVRSELEYRQSQLRLQQLENQVRIEVRNAQFGLQQNRASVASAQAAVDLAKQSLDAEQKKYSLGASTSTLVLQYQSGLTSAEVTLVSAKAAYEKAQLELDRATGLLLDHANIEIADAVSGQVRHAVSVPHVAQRPADRAPSSSAAAAIAARHYRSRMGATCDRTPRCGRTMNILLLISHGWRGGRASGMEIYTLELIRGLKAKGHSTFLVTGRSDSDSANTPFELVTPDLELPFHTINPLSNISTYRQLRRLVAEHQIDIIHAQHRTAGYFAELLQRQHGVPNAVTVHDPWHSTPFKRWHGGLFRRVIAVSEFIRQELILKFHFPPERVRTIHNGVDPARFAGITSEQREQFRSQYGIAADEVVLTQIGRISRAKGQSQLIQALGLLPKEIKYRCLIVGEGRERPQLERETNRLGLHDKVTFCGFRDDIPVVLAGSDVMVLPSRHEPFGLAVVEAMLSNVAVIATNAGGVPEIITHGKDGLLFQPGDVGTFARHLDELVRDPELRCRLAEAGHKTAQARFLLSRMVDETEAYYREIIAQSQTTDDVKSVS